MRKILLLTLLLPPLLLLNGCSLLGIGGDDAEPEKDLVSGAQILRKRAERYMESGDFVGAVRDLETLEARFPFSNEARQGQIDLIYAYYRNGEPEAAIEATEQFERENPTHPRLDYALYMRGLAQFKGESAFYHRILGVDLSKRPPVQARGAFASFSSLVRRFPDSIYAPDARQRMVFLRNRLCEHENHIARYYYGRGAYAAAINRARFSIESYSGAPQVGESLAIMVESYKQLGLNDLAMETQRVLEATAPDTKIKLDDSAWWAIW